MKIIAQNKKAFHDYDIIETYETGIVLKGDEVKSLRAGHAQLVGSFGSIHNHELFLINCQISPYSHAFQKDEELVKRSRKLLVSRSSLIVLPLKLLKRALRLFRSSSILRKKAWLRSSLPFVSIKKRMPAKRR